MPAAATQLINLIKITQGSQSEQLRTLLTFSGGAIVSGIQRQNAILTDGNVTMLSDI